MTVVIACSGFPVPVSTYWGEFGGVEINDTERALPGAGTVRRWLRESPDGYVFTVLAPAEIGASGFRRTNDNKAHLETIGGFAATLGARAVVFQAPEDFKPTKAAKTALRSFRNLLDDGFPTAVFDLPAWDPRAVADAVSDTDATAAYDPLQDDVPSDDGLLYARLPGPAGYRSRYDEAALDQVAEHLAAVREREVFCVLRNIDRHPNGLYLRDALSAR